MPAYSKALEEKEDKLRNLIRRQYLSHDMSQAELIKQVGWSQPDISRLLSHDRTRRFSLQRMAEIAPYLGITVNVSFTVKKPK